MPNSYSNEAARASGPDIDEAHTCSNCARERGAETTCSACSPAPAKSAAFDYHQPVRVAALHDLDSATRAAILPEFYYARRPHTWASVLSSVPGHEHAWACSHADGSIAVYLETELSPVDMPTTAAGLREMWEAEWRSRGRT